MWYRKANEIDRLKRELGKAKEEVYTKQYQITTLQCERDSYKVAWETLEKNRPRTIEEQLFEARKIQEELQNKKTLARLLKSNAKLQEENN